MTSHMTPADSALERPATSHDHRDFWSCIDAVYVVNLKHRTDRWDRMHKILRKHLPEEKIVRVDAELGSSLPGYGEKPWFTKRTDETVTRVKAGSAGCCLSHRKAIELARAAGHRRILLMEDDADFYNELDTPEGDRIAELLQDDDAWDMFYLGYYQRVNKHHVVQRDVIDGRKFELRRIRGPLMLHAAVIHERIFDELLAGLPNKQDIWRWTSYWGSIDSWIYNAFGRQRHIRIWACEPKLVMQIVSHSDICGRPLTVEESIGTHRTSTVISLDADAFAQSLPVSAHTKLYQTYKRSMRLVKDRFLGYRKT
jgi:hypothetical protein